MDSLLLIEKIFNRKNSPIKCSLELYIYETRVFLLLFIYPSCILIQCLCGPVVSGLTLLKLLTLLPNSLRSISFYMPLFVIVTWWIIDLQRQEQQLTFEQCSLVNNLHSLLFIHSADSVLQPVLNISVFISQVTKVREVMQMSQGYFEDDIEKYLMCRIQKVLQYQCLYFIFLIGASLGRVLRA